MIQSDRHCGTCGNALLLKEFRGADVFVCQSCKTVTVSKGDFKRLLGGGPAAPPAPPPPARPAPMSVETPLERSLDFGDMSAAASDDDGPSLGFLRTEETEEFPGGPEPGTMAPTEIAGSGPMMDDDAYASELTERASPYGGVDDLPYDIQEQDDDDFDAELTAYQARKSRTTLFVGVGIVALLALVGLAAGGAVIAGVFATSGSDADAVEAPVAAPEPAPVVPEPAPAPAAPEPEPEPAKPEPAKPEPEPAKPAPAGPQPPSEPAPAGPGALVRRGWGAFDRSPAEAEGFFRQALDIQPNHADANYGYGYALLKQGRATEATPYLCKAQQTGDAEISRDIRALLTHNGLSCE